MNGPAIARWYACETRVRGRVHGSIQRPGHAEAAPGGGSAPLRRFGRDGGRRESPPRPGRCDSGRPVGLSVGRAEPAGPLELAKEEHVTLLSARYEGFDERIVEHLCTDSISVGPYVLSNGDLPAMVLVDAIARRLPGALSEGSGELESFSRELGGGLEYPHFTRPAEFRGWQVPDVLLSGDHARIESWRKEHVR